MEVETECQVARGVKFKYSVDQLALASGPSSERLTCHRTDSMAPPKKTQNSAHRCTGCSSTFPSQQGLQNHYSRSQICVKKAKEAYRQLKQSSTPQNGDSDMFDIFEPSMFTDPIDDTSPESPGDSSPGAHKRPVKPPSISRSSRSSKHKQVMTLGSVSTRNSPQHVGAARVHLKPFRLSRRSTVCRHGVLSKTWKNGTSPNGW